MQAIDAFSEFLIDEFPKEAKQLFKRMKAKMPESFALEFHDRIAYNQIAESLERLKITLGEKHGK